MIIDRHRDCFLGLLLPDYVLVKEGLYFGRAGKLESFGFIAHLRRGDENVVAETDTIIADERLVPGKEAFDLGGRFAAEITAMMRTVCPLVIP
jgi:hypothetical protein